MQDQTQKIFLWCIIFIVSVFIVVWLSQRRCGYCQNKCWQCDEKSRESYSPYRNTGGCPQNIGWAYLNTYDDEDYYKKYPYVYPTSTSYTTAWYAGRRANNAFLEKQRDEMQKYAFDHQIL